MFIILIAVVIGVVWLWLAIAYGRIVVKFLWWFFRELAATPTAVSRDIRRLRGLPPKQSRKARRVAEMWRRNGSLP